jgi:hypothetical protein
MTIIDISSKRDLNKYINNNKSNYKTFCFITSEKEWCKKFNDSINSLTSNITNFNSGVIFTRANVDKESISKDLEVATYPVIRIYKNGEIQEEIFCSYPNIIQTVKEHFF